MLPRYYRCSRGTASRSKPLSSKSVKALRGARTGDTDFQKEAIQVLNLRLETLLIDMGSDSTSHDYAEWNKAARHALEVVKGQAELSAA